MTSALVGLTTLGEELASLAPALEPQQRRRFPVHRTKRTEQRAEIDRGDRIAVYTRDHFRCLWCGNDEKLTLDHIIPWSAGGSDDVDNLRTLCWDCNEYRSNFHHPADELATRILPLTFWCADCDANDPEVANHHPGVQPVYCWWCKQESVGIPGRWFPENNAFWDYDLNWHRDKYPGFTRDAWEEACSRIKFPILYEDKPVTEAVRRALAIQEAVNG